MRRHLQRTKTDCFRACVACLLDIEDPGTVPDWYEGLGPGEEIPHFILIEQAKWFAHRGLALIETRYGDEAATTVIDAFSAHHPGLPFILQGLSSHGSVHAAVYRDGGLVHDPHPRLHGEHRQLGIHARLSSGMSADGPRYYSVFLIGLNVGDPYWKANLIRNL